MQECYARQMGSLLNIFEKSSFLPASNVDYGNIFLLKERGVDFRLSKNILSSTPKRPKQKLPAHFTILSFQKVSWRAQGGVWQSFAPHLLLVFLGGFGNSFRAVSVNFG